MKSIYNFRRILLTGYIGFKGSWLAVILRMPRADVTDVKQPKRKIREERVASYRMI